MGRLSLPDAQPFLFEVLGKSSSPYINRFLSADTIVPNYANPQSLNRFSYVNNSPLNYVDPSGHVACRTKEECEDVGMNPGGSPLKPKPDKDKDDDGDQSETLQQQLQYCLEHSYAPSCDLPTDAIRPVRSEYDLILPWEFNRMDAWGFRFNGTGCFIIACGDIGLDLIGNTTTGEGTLFITPGIHFGLGFGVDGSVGLVGAYDAPYNSSLAEASQNLSINITPGTGGQGSYSVSESPNVTGNYAQTYSVAVSAGGEASAVYGPSYSIPIGTCTRTDCYWGVK